MLARQPRMLPKRSADFGNEVNKPGLSCFYVFALGALVATALFAYAFACPFSRRIQGDSLEYIKIAGDFTSISKAVSYTGDRTYGYPLFLHLVRQAAAPPDLAAWMADIAIAQFCLHLAASVFFYSAFLKPLFKKAGLPQTTAAASAAMVMCYPALVTYTTLPLTDTFCTDLLMIAAGLGSIARHQLPGKTVSLHILCGLILGYSVMVRPSFWPAVLAACVAAFIHALLQMKKERICLLKAASLATGIAAVIVPALRNGQAAYGTPALQNPEFTRECTISCMRSGLYSVRVFWSFTRRSKEPLPGIRDPYLARCYQENQQSVQSLAGLLGHLFTKPAAVPVYIVKKTIALFDEPHVQPYYAEETPEWFSSIQRVFETMAFCGLVALLITFTLILLGKHDQPWIGPMWSMLAIFLLMTHGVVQVEGRYGFPVIPLCLTSLFLGYAQARRHGPYYLLGWSFILIIAAAVFLLQVTSWDRVVPV
jgi:hypothetical protein